MDKPRAWSLATRNCKGIFCNGEPHLDQITDAAFWELCLREDDKKSDNIPRVILNWDRFLVAERCADWQYRSVSAAAECETIVGEGVVPDVHYCIVRYHRDLEDVAGVVDCLYCGGFAFIVFDRNMKIVASYKSQRSPDKQTFNTEAIVHGAKFAYSL